MFRLLRRRFAVHSYFWRLSQELARRFGKKDYYSIAEVSTSAHRAGFDLTFLAYAHGMFCSRRDFEEYYDPMRVACTYDGVRKVVAHRFFGGAIGFNAMNILLRTTPPRGYDYDSAPLTNAP